MSRKLASLCVLGIWMLISCAPAAPAALPGGLVLVTANPDASATPTPFQPNLSQETPVPSALPAPSEAPPTALPPTATPVPEPTTPPSTPVPATSRTQYILYTTLAYSGHSVSVDETVRYVNTTGTSLSSVVLAVEPNLWTGCFSLAGLSQDDAALTNYSLNGQQLTVNLNGPLAPGAATTLRLNYSLALPAKRYEGTFGYLGYQVNLTDWFPFVVPYAGGWILHDPMPFGEHLVYDAADFEVNLKVDDPAVVVAASGLAEANGDWTRYRLQGARTFSISASDRFLVQESAVGPIVIRSYYFAGDENAGDRVLTMAKQSIALYDVKFAPYSYPVLSVVESDVPDGQEFDALVFLASKFYSDYNGTAKSNLVVIGTHEIAHQWWFGLVGSDQALEPWLDEAMAVYSERLFFEFNYPRYGDWWWNYRVNYFGAEGWVDTDIYNGATFRAYTDAVYLNGSDFIQAIRGRIGDDAFFAFLKDYAGRYAYGRATTSDFLAVLGEHTSVNFSDIVASYFQQPP